jgi:hypothetical protein
MFFSPNGFHATDAATVSTWEEACLACDGTIYGGGAVDREKRAVAARIGIFLGDITMLYGEGLAIVNSASRTLRSGGGVNRRIHDAAGPELEQACVAAAPQGLKTAECLITPGFNLQAPFVIHAVLPSHGHPEDL